MTNEFEILKCVESKDTITQRELAKKTGLSLGAVNVLIKRLINKGLLKVEHLNARTIRYFLTPKGLMEKARLTYQYIILSYNHISKIESAIEQIVKNKRNSAAIFLYGEKDELYEIIVSKLHSLHKPYTMISDIDKTVKCNENDSIIIVWNPELIHEECQTKVFNILNAI
ncbi:MAG: winged helix-turn-helix transcriptional regulator [Ruminiclostridium sp.]|nr:winged helix-turn-helix transcriptional regulator [Ruminiclostridium sp.]